MAGNRGIICVELTAQENHYLLVISDDGTGLPADFNPQISQTLGMSLMRGLSKQIGGSLEIRQQDGKGVDVRLEFSEETVGREQVTAL